MTTNGIHSIEEKRKEENSKEKSSSSSNINKYKKNIVNDSCVDSLQLTANDSCDDDLQNIAEFYNENRSFNTIWIRSFSRLCKRYVKRFNNICNEKSIRSKCEKHKIHKRHIK